jgi:hypothetical protein
LRLLSGKASVSSSICFVVNSVCKEERGGADGAVLFLTDHLIRIVDAES